MIEPPRDGSSSSRSDPDSPRLRKQLGDLPPVIAALPYTAIAQALRRVVLVVAVVVTSCHSVTLHPSLRLSLLHWHLIYDLFDKYLKGWVLQFSSRSRSVCYRSTHDGTHSLVSTSLYISLSRSKRELKYIWEGLVSCIGPSWGIGSSWSSRIESLDTNHVQFQNNYTS